MRINNLFIILILFSSCKIAENYKPGGFGSVNGGAAGNTSSLVTISGRVMSTATYNSTQGNILGIKIRKDYVLKQDEFIDSTFNYENSYVQNICSSSDPCANATWTLKFLGNDKIISTGSSNCGTFEIPSVPSDKEGLVSFSCSDGTIQRCIAKAGDQNLNCNTVADAVVATIELSLKSSMLDPAMNGKILAKMATTIVESTNTDNSESDDLKIAVENCKTIKNDQLKNECFKNTIENSTHSSTLSVVKSLAATWSVRNVFNLIIGTANYSIYLDRFIYSDFGKALDEWTGSNFIAETKLLLEDLVLNPDYIGGDPLNGEQIMKLECQVNYSKFNSGGNATYKPLIKLINGLNVPSCNNEQEIAKIVGILDADPTQNQKIIDYINFVNTNQNGSFQFGTPNLNCPQDSMSVRGSFCVRTPSLILTSRIREPDRNDPSGEQTHFFNDNTISFVSIFPAVWSKLMPIVTASSQGTSLADNPLYHCAVAAGDGPPAINFSNQKCKDTLQTAMSSVRTEFSGLLGLYNYLNYPQNYNFGAGIKLSLEDIHNIFTRVDFFNAKLFFVGFGEYGSRHTASNQWSPPMINFDNTSVFIPSTFNVLTNDTNLNLTENEFFSILDNGKLSNRYDLTFSIFETIPTNSVLQASIQNASHHEDYNLYGSKYSYVLGSKKANYSDPNAPIYCRMIHKTTLAPMLKELNPNTKIECITDPLNSPYLVTESPAGSGKFINLPNGYPYVLFDRGFNGDNKGRIFSLADRRTGIPIRIGQSEIYILQAVDGNHANPTDHSFVVTGLCNSTNYDSVVSVRAFYGQGSGAKNEVIPAFCLDMSLISEENSDTKVYPGGQIDITQNFNGTNYTYSQTLAGGRLNTDNFSMRPVCWFANASYFDVNPSNSSEFITNSNYNTNTSPTSTFQLLEGGTLVNKTLVGPQVNDAVDFCDSTAYSSKTMLNLIQIWENRIYDVTNTNLPFRNSKPFLIYNSKTKTLYNGLITNIGLIESKLSNLQMANTGISYNYFNTKLLNLKHDSKFDPFCDDLNNNHKCDCVDSTSKLVIGRECTLADTVIEPTLSKPPFNYGNPTMAQKFETFFSLYGGKSGTDLAGMATYMTNNSTFPDLDDILFCKNLKLNETTYRKPTSIPFGKFESLNVEGCPNDAGIIDPTPLSGGGPIRVARPSPMNNAYDITQPRLFMSMVNYATKSIGQGNRISKKDKLFSFDEAIALVATRQMLSPRGLDIRKDTSTGKPMTVNALKFGNQRLISNKGNTDIISSILKGIIKPNDLKATEPTSKDYADVLKQMP